MEIPEDLPSVIQSSFQGPQHVEMINRAIFRYYKKLFRSKYSMLNKTLLSPFGGETIRFKDVMWFNLNEYEHERHRGELWFKYTLDKDAPWRKIKMVKRNALQTQLGMKV